MLWDSRRWVALTDWVYLLTLSRDGKQRDKMMSNETEVPGPTKERRKSGVADRRDPKGQRRSDGRVVTVTTQRRQRRDRRKENL